MVHSQRLAGKTALVTGATSGIGRAIATAYAAAGAHVIASGRDEARGAAIAEATGGAFVRADLDGSQAASHELARAATEAAGGTVDVLVNHAGIFPGGPTASIDEETFDAVYATNVKAPFFLTAAIAPAMAERGSGAIVNIGSWVAWQGLAGSALYSSSKAAMELLTKAWAAEYGPSGVRVNAIAPGLIKTWDDDEGQEYRLRLAGVTPAARPGRPEEIALAAVYLASEEAAFVHGISLPVDGGRLNVAVV
jgi:NAD(P)-dependent dehydrogenase (short-subunit alcohol dehydrogenase family)